MITLRDVAKKGGVSLATASMALNDNEKINIDTRERIKKIAQELNYVPDARARALVKKKTRIVGLVIPEINNPFFYELANAVKKTLKKADYNIILCSPENIEEEKKYIDMFRSGQVDGAIFTCHKNKENSRLIRELAEKYKPVVHIDQITENDGTIPLVSSNRSGGAYKVTSHLIDLGHSSIAFVGNKADERYKGFLKAMSDHKLVVQKKYIFNNCLTLEDGFNIGKLITNLIELPTGIICHNDEVAIGLMQYLTNSGIKIPKDISISGFDNISFARFYNPSLTTVNISIEKMGIKAAEILLQLIQTNKIADKDLKVEYQTELIVRNSTARPPQNY